MVVDTGVYTDIIDKATFDEINCSIKIQLMPLTKCLLTYGSKSQFNVLSKFQQQPFSKAANCLTSTFHVLPSNYRLWLGYKTAACLLV